MPIGLDEALFIGKVGFHLGDIVDVSRDYKARSRQVQMGCSLSIIAYEGLKAVLLGFVL